MNLKEEDDIPAAFGLLRRACSLEPDDVIYNRELARLVLDNNLDVEAGLAACDRLMVTDEENQWRYLWWISELYQRRGWKKEARDPLQKALKLIPDEMNSDRLILEQRLAELGGYREE